MPNSCVFCGRIKGKNDKVSMFRFPADEAKRDNWLKALSLSLDEISANTRICSRHFLNGDPSSTPSPDLGKRFASPKKPYLPRSTRAAKRSKSMSVPQKSKRCHTTSTPCSSHESSVTESYETHETSDTGNARRSTTPADKDVLSPLSVSAGEQYFTDYNIHELPSCDDSETSARTESEVYVKARAEYLETQQKMKQLDKKPDHHFRIEQIAEKDDLIQFYTGFASYQLLLKFFNFLGPSVNQLTYWGDEVHTTTFKRKMSLTPINQFFLTLTKLRLNLKTVDLSVRFGISTGLVSRYFNTWVCFLFQHMKEIDWTPSVEQVAGTLPCSFQKFYPTTYSILDASELFIETPSDLFAQSSTWSNYKQHNTAKFLIGCTPNGVISYVSPLYVGSVSDVELTRVSGYLDTLDGKEGCSVMADRGFTIRDMLATKGIDLNIPPFMEGKKQFTESDIQKGRRIASLRIHVERAIGRVKNYGILKGVFPISMIRIANQIVCVCAWLTNFQPALIPPPSDSSVEEVDEYFQKMESESDYDADTEMSDDEL